MFSHVNFLLHLRKAFRISWRRRSTKKLSPVQSSCTWRWIFPLLHSSKMSWKRILFHKLHYLICFQNLMECQKRFAYDHAHQPMPPRPPTHAHPLFAIGVQDCHRVLYKAIRTDQATSLHSPLYQSEQLKTNWHLPLQVDCILLPLLQHAEIY